MIDNNKISELITEELNKSDVIDLIKNNKDFERRIKVIVREIVKDMFRVLWQHNSIFSTLGN